MNDYIRKTLKVSLFGLKNNKVVITVMFALSLCLAVIWNEEFAIGNYSQAVAAAMGVLLPIIMLGYVQRRTENDFYNSMPIKRSQYFLGYSISCVISFLIIYIILFIPTIAFCSVDARNFFLGLAVFFTVFAVTVLAIMLSGSLLSTLVTLLILNAAVFEIFTLILNAACVNNNVYMNTYHAVVYMFTPFSILDPDIDILSALLTLLMAAVNLVIAFFLHRYRKNESTVALAFPKTRYIIQYLTMFMAALLFSAAGYPSFRVFGYRSEGRTFTNFMLGVLEDNIVVYTLIAIFVTFIVTNMIFENSPRGALKKIRHLFIFILSYAVFFVFVVGGLLYTNLPYTFVPFDSNFVLMSVHQYEEMGRVSIKTGQDEYYYNGSYYTVPPETEEARTADDTENTKETKTFTAVTEHVSNLEIAEPDTTWAANEIYTSYFGNIIYEESERDKWIEYRDENYVYYLRETDTVVYAVTDKEYINYLCERVKKSGIYFDLFLGYSGIFVGSNSDFQNYSDMYDWRNETIYNGAYVCSIMFFDLKDNNPEEYISLMEQDADIIKMLRAEESFTIPTYIESEDVMEEFKAHTAYSYVKPVEPLDYDIEGSFMFS